MRARLLPCLLLLAFASCGGSSPPTEAPGSPAMALTDLSLTFTEYVRAPREDVWDALTTAETTRRFFHGTAVQSSLAAGSPFRHVSASGERTVIEGEVREATRPSRLVYSFRFPEYDDRDTLVVYSLADAGAGTTKLTISHSGFERATRTYRRVFDGWPPVLSGLKTLLESGEPLAIPSYATDASRAGRAPGTQRYVTYLRSRPEDIWRGLMDPERTVHYFHGLRIDGQARVGGGLGYATSDGRQVIEGEVLLVEEPRSLEMTFLRSGSGDEPSRLAYRIDDLGAGTCRLTVTHAFRTRDETFRRVRVGWPAILSGLKTLLETGEPLVIERE